MDNFYSRCLLCTCRPDVTPHLHIFSDVGKQLQLVDKINKFLNIQIEAELPQNVCHSCMEKLEVTHELVTSSQQARIMLLQMKQQSEEVKQENCSMTELDSYQPSTDSAAVDNEMEENEMDNCSAEDFDQSDSALHCTTEGTVDQTEAFEEVFISKIEIEEHAIKLEPGEDQLDCLPQNQCRDMEPPLESKFAKHQVLVAKLLECDFCCFYSDNKTHLATHMQAHLHTPNTSDGLRSPPANEGVKFIHKCAECGVKFANPEMYAWHTENCHGTDAIIKVVKISYKEHDYQCVFCATVCKSMEFIIRHLHSHHRLSNLPFHCSACKKQFVAKSNLKRHQSSCKNKKTASSCNIGASQDSVNSSKQNGVKCMLCTEFFISENIMKIHISQVHVKKNKELYKCLHCEQSFTLIPHLKSHCHSSHPGKYMFQCDLCNAGFNSRKCYRRHKKYRHEEHVLTCDICEAKFTSPTRYREHKRFKHENRTLTCNVCNKIFVSFSGYRYHKKYTHGTQVFTCDICSVTFSSPKNLRVHTKSFHSVLKNTFSCDFCKKKFKCKTTLQWHIRSLHTAPILHCQHCQYSTRNKGNFTQHLKRRHLELL